MSPRRLVALRGAPGETAAAAARLCAELDEVLAVGPQATSPGQVRRLLGQSFAAVTIDAHAGLDADLLGRCHGLVRGGGALVLRLPPPGVAPRWAPLALQGFPLAQAGTRFWERLERTLSQWGPPPSAPLAPTPFAPRGSPEQARVVAALTAGFHDPTPRAFALLADRGRGKSSALGLALTRALSERPLQVAVSAPSRAAAAELLRFAPEDGTRVRFLAPDELLRDPAELDLVLVDEAAQVSVPLLRELVRRRPRARLAFATTTHGYEGTGRGFVLRFLRWLEASGRPLTRLELRAPIRWSAGDPLEAWVFRLLALDAELSEPPASPRLEVAPPAPRQLERAELARDERLLRALFALLVHAHYRTTPGDLQRLLDAPNLSVHAIACEGQVWAATLVAREGGLDPETCAELAAGRWRIRGHALPDTLVVHCARPAAGEQRFVRSVRIATHPELRRRGLARALVEHVHASYRPDLFGTLFGATPELLRFRRSLGYRPVRLGLTRSARSGEPSVALLRPGSERGAALLASLQADLARDLPLQLEWLAAESGLPPHPDLARALARDLPPPAPLPAAEVARRYRRGVASPQPLEAFGYVVERWLREHPARLAALEPRARQLLEGRVFARRAWSELAAAGGWPNLAQALAAARRALQALAAAEQAPSRGRGAHPRAPNSPPSA